MLTLPLYLQIVTGLTPTESGFAMLPMVLGLMIASIGSGQIIARTGKYRIFPITGTAFTALGFLYADDFVTVDKPLWFLMIGMFLIGLGLGQLMQTLTLASQNSVEPQDMGVATSASTFFRQIGGTLGAAILLSVLFSALPANIMNSLGNEKHAGRHPSTRPSTRRSRRRQRERRRHEADLEPDRPPDHAVGAGPARRRGGHGDRSSGRRGHPAGHRSRPGPGRCRRDPGRRRSGHRSRRRSRRPGPLPRRPRSPRSRTRRHATVVDGTVSVDYSDAGQRGYWVDQLAPTIADSIRNGDSSTSDSASSSTSDTSFLNGADKRLSAPFLIGFNSSVVTVYWIALSVILLAFVLSLFFKVPPLRKRSALQEQADKAGLTETGSIRTA